MDTRGSVKGLSNHIKGVVISLTRLEDSGSNNDSLDLIVIDEDMESQYLQAIANQMGEMPCNMVTILPIEFCTEDIEDITANSKTPKFNQGSDDPSGMSM